MEPFVRPRLQSVDAIGIRQKGISGNEIASPEKLILNDYDLKQRNVLQMGNFAALDQMRGEVKVCGALCDHLNAKDCEQALLAYNPR